MDYLSRNEIYTEQNYKRSIFILPTIFFSVPKAHLCNNHAV